MTAKARPVSLFRRTGAFAWRTLKAFKANQGLLLAGAVAYYALLSLIPLLILILIVLSHFVAGAELLEAMSRYLDWLVPGQGGNLTAELARFLEHREVLGPILVLTMAFFSSLAFTVLENAMSVIFIHRVAIRRRRFLVSAVLPYVYIVILGIGMLLVTLVSASLQAMGDRSVEFLGHTWGLDGISGVLLYLLGVAGEVCIVTAIYMVMPVGRLQWRNAIVGGITAALLWELTRHVLLWYFDTLSRVSEVYGSLTMAIVVLLSLEIAATLLLLGAQVIAEFERLGTRGEKAPPEPMRTG